MSQRNKNLIDTPGIRVRIGLLQKTTLLRMPRDEDKIMLMIMIMIKIAAITMLRYYVISRRNIDSEKSKSQMRLEPTTLHDLFCLI